MRMNFETDTAGVIHWIPLGRSRRVANQINAAARMRKDLIQLGIDKKDAIKAANQSLWIGSLTLRGDRAHEVFHAYAKLTGKSANSIIKAYEKKTDRLQPRAHDLVRYLKEELVQ